MTSRLEFRVPTWGPSIPLGRFGTSPPRMTLAPYVQALALAAGASRTPSRVSGVYPSAGLGMLFFYDLLRADVAYGVRQGNGTWRFAIDIDRSFWGIL